MRETVFILDAAGFIFRAYFALPEMKNSSGQGTQAIFGFIRSINKCNKNSVIRTLAKQTPVIAMFYQF